MKKKIPHDRCTLYYYLKKDFLSAYNNNGHNIRLAILQVANLRDMTEKEVEGILVYFIGKMKLQIKRRRNGNT